MFGGLTPSTPPEVGGNEITEDKEGAGTVLSLLPLFHFCLFSAFVWALVTTAVTVTFFISPTSTPGTVACPAVSFEAQRISFIAFLTHGLPSTVWLIKYEWMKKVLTTEEKPMEGYGSEMPCSACHPAQRVGWKALLDRAQQTCLPPSKQPGKGNLMTRDRSYCTYTALPKAPK